MDTQTLTLNHTTLLYFAMLCQPEQRTKIPAPEYLPYHSPIFYIPHHKSTLDMLEAFQGRGGGGYALALLVISEIACCLDCCCHISFLPFCQLPVLTERIAASFQGHVTYMPSLCWSFLRLPVAWIVVVTSLSSLSANCQCLLRGLPPVFRATSPIASTLQKASLWGSLPKVRTGWWHQSFQQEP